jgi:hypothetical protein
MSDLQLSLLIIGILIVAATYFFNWLQERKYRRKSETAFQNNVQDVLLEPQGASGAVDGRVEPQLREPAIAERGGVVDKPAADKAAVVLDPEIMFIAEISRTERPWEGLCCWLKRAAGRKSNPSTTTTSTRRK